LFSVAIDDVLLTSLGKTENQADAVLSGIVAEEADVALSGIVTEGADVAVSGIVAEGVAFGIGMAT